MDQQGLADGSFEPTGARDKFGRKRLHFGKNGKPGIELAKVWRVQNVEFGSNTQRAARELPTALSETHIDSLPGALHLPASARARLHARRSVSIVVYMSPYNAWYHEVTKLELRKRQEFLLGAVVTLQESGGTLRKVQCSRIVTLKLRLHFMRRRKRERPQGGSERAN